MVVFGQSDLIFQCIQIYGGVSIRSLGTFLLDFDSATMVAGRLLLSPPVQKLTFKHDFESNLELSILLSQIGISEQTIDKINQSIEREITGAKLDKQTLYFNKLGSLKFDVEFPKFQVEDQTQFNKFKNFPELSLLPIQRIQNDIGIPFLQNSSINSKPPSLSWSYIFWPIGIILLVCGVLLLRSCETSSEIDDDKTNSAHNENQLLKENNDVYETNTDLVEIDSTEFVEEIVEIDTKTALPETNVESPKEIVKSKDDSCIFVVGAFQVKNNAKNLQKRLTQMGYSVEVSNYDKFKRVGVVFSCNTLDTSTQFSKLKSDFPELWVLN